MASKAKTLRKAPVKARRRNATGIRNATYRSPDPWLADILGARPSSAGVEVNEKTALSVAAVFACVRNLSEDVAKVPLIVYRELPNGGKEPATTHPVFAMLRHAPNENMTSFSF